MQVGAIKFWKQQLWPLKIARWPVYACNYNCIANFKQIILLVGKRNKDRPKTWLNVTCASHGKHNCTEIASTDLYECVTTKTRSQSTTKRYLSASKEIHRWYKCEVWRPETAALMPSPLEASVACWILSLLACNVIINYKFYRSCTKHVVSRPCTLKVLPGDIEHRRHRMHEHRPAMLCL